jgi:hypothetical protein
VLEMRFGREEVFLPAVTDPVSQRRHPSLE